MPNLSLARIMYGTNEGLHTSRAMSAPTFSSLTAQSVSENSPRESAGSGSGTLSQLLHKAWTALNGQP
ncbi:MAG: hypothetical protein WBL63_06900 [Candidatus Acidiferrum sp.]